MAARSYASGRFALTLGGQTCGFMKSCTPGGLTADVADMPQATDNIVKKTVANFKWDDWTISVALGMGHNLYNWMKQALDKSAVPQSGELIIADFDYKAQRVVEFYDALITGITFPKCAAEGKEIGYVNLSFSPTRCRTRKGDGSDIRGLIGPKSKSYATNNFRVDISGLTEECKRVAEVGEMKFESKIATDHVGIHNEPEKCYAALSQPDFDIKFSGADNEAWDNLTKGFFVDGARLESNEHTGSIEYLGPDMKTVLATLSMQNMGLKKMAHGDLAPNDEKMQRMNAVFYVESYHLEIKEYDA